MKIALLTTDNREHQRTYEEKIPRFGPAIEALLQGFAASSELELHVISCTQQPMLAPEKLAHNTWFHLLHVPKIGWLRTGYQGCIRAIRRKLHQLEPDLVHGQGTERECAISAAYSGYPNVVTIHGNMRAVAQNVGARVGSYLWCAARLEPYALKRTNGILCNSSYTQKLVGEFNLRTWSVPNAVRLPFFERPLISMAARERPILLNVGVIAIYKRQLEILAVAQRLRGAGRHLEIRFVGEIPAASAYGTEFRRKLETLEDGAFARHLPPQGVEKLIDTLDAASALIHFPSEEAFGLVVAEALSRNLAVFGAHIGGVPDIAEGVEGAKLYAPDDEAGLERAIRDWLSRGCSGPKEAAAEMRRRYHPSVIAQRHLEIYRDLVERV